jgi:uncharacterized protein YdhG (YjbR/CyaY superfamily)
MTPDEYIRSLPEERQEAMQKLRITLKEHLPEGFEECFAYKMITFVVPHSIYPAGYHCDPKQALPFISIASQKNFIAFYHMGIYASPELMNWFTEEYVKVSKAKLDMGKSCIRFKKSDQIPFSLLAELASKMTVQDWIGTYERVFRK